MDWLVIFTDKAETAGLRAQTKDAHLAFLAAHPQIVVAGSVAEPPESVALGGAWIITGVLEFEARTLCESDPFYRVGMRASYRLLSYEAPDRFAPWRAPSQVVGA